MTIEQARAVLAHPAQRGGLQSVEVYEAIGLMIAAGEVREPAPASAEAALGAMMEAPEAQPTPRRKYRAVGNLEVGGETYGERLARLNEQHTGDDSPATKLLRVWKAEQPGRECAIQDDFERRGVMVSLRQGGTQRTILIPWPDVLLSRESAWRATAAEVAKVIDAMREATEPLPAAPSPPVDGAGLTDPKHTVCPITEAGASGGLDGSPDHAVNLGQFDGAGGLGAQGLAVGGPDQDSAGAAVVEDLLGRSPAGDEFVVMVPLPGGHDAVDAADATGEQQQGEGEGKAFRHDGSSEGIVAPSVKRRGIIRMTPEFLVARLGLVEGVEVLDCQYHFNGYFEFMLAGDPLPECGECVAARTLSDPAEVARLFRP